MKVGTTLSVSLHTAVLTWALVSLGSPPPLMMVEEQGVEVDLASLSPAAQDAQGEKKADFDRKPTPKPTKRQEVVPEAKNTGEAKQDGAKSRSGEVTDKVLDTEKTSAAPKAERVQQAPEVKPEPVVKPQPKPEPVPTTEVATEPEPKVPITPDPIADAIADAADIPDPAQPAAIPVPVRAPRDRPKPQPAATTERKVAEAEPQQKKTATSTEDSKSVTDKIGQLLNTQEDTASGAKRVASIDPSIGNPDAKPAAQLTRGEYGALKGRVSQCWSIPTYVEQENMRIILDMRMSPDGNMEEITSIAVEGVDNPAHVRAVQSSLTRNLDRRNCNFADVLPADKFDTWREVRVNFAPSEF